MPFFLDSLQNILKESIPDIVIKYSVKAKEYETVDTKRDGDRYVCAKLKIDTFKNYTYFPRSVLEASGFTEDEINKYQNNPSQIPYNRRTSVVVAMREYIVSTYVEQNNYYRMLYGLPDLEDKDEVWFDYDVYKKYNITPSAVHEIDHNDLLILESYGELQKVIDKYPKKQYLKFLGKRKVELTVSRLSDNFEILYFPRLPNQDNFYKEFLMTYESCREYFMTVIYNRYYTGKYDYYDNAIAFNILIMAINKMISKSLIQFKQREFYDIDSMKIFLNAYGIPIINTLNMQQLRLLCKNINILLQEKATSKVFIDIMDLLNFGNIQVRKYYLIKRHKMTEFGKPMFIYKSDEDGNLTDELDLEKMYDFYFLHNNINDYRIQENIENETDIIPYQSMVGNDPYWKEDSELKNKLLNSNFNYIETKYIDFDVIYRMNQLLFDTVYLTRSVLDNPDTKSVTISLAKFSSADIRLFDAFIFLICMMCKYYNVKPSLLKTPSKVLYIEQFDFDKDLKVIVQDVEGKCKTINSCKINGYNYKADLTKIQNEVKSNPYLDNRLLNYLDALVMKDVNTINLAYLQIKELKDLLIDQMMRSDSFAVYNAYEKIYKTLLITDYNNEICKLDDGTVPNYYDEYLKESNYTLYEYYINTTDRDEICNMIDYMTERLTTIFQDVKMLNQIKILDKSQIESIISLLNFFKTYTVMIKDANLLLILDDRYLNTVFMKYDMLLGEDEMVCEGGEKAAYDGIEIFSGNGNLDDSMDIHDNEIFVSDIDIDDEFSMNEYKNQHRGKINIHTNDQLNERYIYRSDSKIKDSTTCRDTFKFIYHD